MNKTEMVDQVAKDTELSKAKAAQAIDAVFAAITGALKGGDRVSMVGFGTFSVAKRAARVGRNPRTGKEIKIPEAIIPRFRPGKGLRDAVAPEVAPPPVAAAAASKTKAKPAAAAPAAAVAAAAAPVAAAADKTTKKRK